jgi:3-oxoacyl-[acyl-carrier protein] reductase
LTDHDALYLGKPFPNHFDRPPKPIIKSIFCALIAESERSSSFFSSKASAGRSLLALQFQSCVSWCGDIVRSVGVMAAVTLSLAGKTAVVTGGSQGIGRAISLLLAKHGANVVVNFSRNVEKANEVVAEIELGAKGKAVAVQADVSKASAVKALFDKAEESFGKIHIVVNSAGIILTNFPSLAETTEEEWDWVAAVNTKGAFLVSREAAKRIPPGGGGRIVNITTTLVATTLPGNAAYTASNAAVESFTKTLAKELRGKQITANCVAPGATATDAFFAGRSAAMIETSVKMSPLERLGEPSDIANVVLFVVSDEGEWLNAQVIRSNGGTASAS